METGSVAKIISYNLYGERVCASAARISTTSGNAYEIFQDSTGGEKDQSLIRKVLASGHKSVIEHMVFTIALWNVSAYVEQFFIECRLASFSVKSRRYVDFSRQGYHIPPDLAGESRARYTRYMDLLFAAYGELLEAGVPREDARFLLPYAFHSNFYCTLNARELVHLIRSIRWGRGRGCAELESLAEQLSAQLAGLCPSLSGELERPGAPAEKAGADGGGMLEPLALIRGEDAGGVELLQTPARPGEVLKRAWQIGHPGRELPAGAGELIRMDRPRELEQLSYTFVISDLTLSGITHLVRHRMQSILIPPLEDIGYGRTILPETVEEDPARAERYRAALEEAARLRREAFADPALERYRCYFALSGNVTDVITTMNARELLLFLRLRTCSRAQWEIRAVAVELLRLLRADFPEVFRCAGPACYMTGACPEGRLTCGRKDEMIASFGGEGPL